MTYSTEYQNEILKRMKTEKFTDIVNDTGISPSTLYNWKKEELFNIAQQFPTDPVIQLRLMETCMISDDPKDLDKAIEIANRFPNHELIQTHLISIYLKSNKPENLDKVIEITKKFPDSEIIQANLISIYLKSNNPKDLNKAIEISKKFPNYIPIQAQIISFYLKQGKPEDLDKATEIAKRFPDYDCIQTQNMSILLKRWKLENLDKAIEIAEKFPDNVYINSQLIAIYLKCKKTEYLDKAIEIAKRFPDNEHIQSQLMSVYSRRNNPEDLDESIEIAKKFTDNAHIQTQLKGIYHSKEEDNDLRKAIIVANKFDNNNSVPKIWENYDTSTSENTLTDEDSNPINETENIDILSLIRAKLYTKTIAPEDIENLKMHKDNLDVKQYYLALIAIYESFNQKNNALEVIKQIKEEDIEIKGINYIRDRLKSKKKIRFDLSKYDEIIEWNTEYTPKYIAELQMQDNEPTTHEKNVETENLSQENNEDEVSLNDKVSKISPKASSMKIFSISSSTKHEKDTSSKQKNKPNKQKQIKTIFSSMSDELRDVIKKVFINYYVQMQPRKLSTNIEKQTEYMQLLQDINNSPYGQKQSKKKQIEPIYTELNSVYYEEQKRQAFYMKRYDKLVNLLNKDKDSKKAQAEIMLMLINEGYKDIVQQEFPEDDYNFITGLIDDYYAKKLNTQDVQKKIDDWSL